MAETETLMIELKKYGFRFYLGESSEKSWFVKVNDLRPDYFVFVEEENREMKNVHDFKYEDFGVKNIVELLFAMVLRPSEYFEQLTGEKAEIEEIHIFLY